LSDVVPRHQTSTEGTRSRTTRVQDVVLRLRDLIARAELPPDGRLPSEQELSQRFGASRATVREALTVLEGEGLIARRRGLGRFLNRLALNLPTRLEEVWDFADMIRSSGYRPSSRYEGMTLGPVAPAVAEKLAIPPGSEVLTTKDVFLADGIPVIYCIDTLPSSLVRSGYAPEELEGPIYTFLTVRCGQRVDYNITEIAPTVADRKLGLLLGCRRGSPLLYLEEVGFNAQGEPILHSQEYYRPEYFSFRVLRKMTPAAL